LFFYLKYGGFKPSWVNCFCLLLSIIDKLVRKVNVFSTDGNGLTKQIPFKSGANVWGNMDLPKIMR